MYLDSQLAFVPVGSPLSIVAGAGVSVPSGVIDVLGLGQGVNPASSLIIGTQTLFGSDLGIGLRRVDLDCAIGAAFATATAATLNMALQVAPDTGVGGGFLPGAWTTIVETGPMAVGILTAGQVIGRFPMLPAIPASLRPRDMPPITRMQTV